MALRNFLNKNLILQRPSNILLDDVAIGSVHTFDRDPPRKTALKIKVSNTGITPSPATVGVNDGTSNETLSFAADDEQSTVNEYQSGVTITPSNFTAGNIEITAVNRLGEEVTQLIDIKNTFIGRIEAITEVRGDIEQFTVGETEAATHTLYALKDASFSFLPKDTVVDGSTQYRIFMVIDTENRRLTNHLEILLKLIPT